MERNTYLTLTPVDEARDRWLSALHAFHSPLDEITVTLADARGRTLSSAVEARRSSPAFHSAAMDGIAVNAEATFTASTRTPLKLEINKDAFWINTGHPLPARTNAVIMVENVYTEGDQNDGKSTVLIEKAAFPWQHVRKLGEDIVDTEILLPPGTVIGAYELGALAAAGVLHPPVFRKPMVAIIPSGSEIVPLHEASEESLCSGACLPEFNSYIFAALVADAGGESVTMPIVPDDPIAIRAAIQHALDSGVDLVVLNAGSSAGSHDYSASVIAEMGKVLVHGVAIMPGKPTVLGMVGKIPVIGTPGYPVSATIAFEEFVQPLLAVWQKRTMPRREIVLAAPCNPLPSRPGMEEHIRVKLGQVDGVFFAIPLPRGAGTVTSLSRADGILRIGKDVEGINQNQHVPVELLRSRTQIEGALLVIGSHDNALDVIDSFLRRKHPRFSLTSAHVGSLGGLMALKRKQCHLAGCHLLDPESGIYNRKAIADNLDESCQLIRLADREQGLLVAHGNPLKIQSIEDLTRADVTFINRQRGSGTRVLLDYQLAQRGISPTAIAGYRDEEYTHMNVAAAVLSGRAHAGLGVRSAAVALGLDFLPVGVEEYDLVIPTRFRHDERILALFDVILSAEFRQTLDLMGGYNTALTGQIVGKS